MCCFGNLKNNGLVIYKVLLTNSGVNRGGKRNLLENNDNRKINFIN